jgi:hypothetical protein
MLTATDIRIEAERLARAAGLGLVETCFTLNSRPYLPDNPKTWSVLQMQNAKRVAWVSMRIENEDLDLPIADFSQRFLEPAICQIHNELEASHA